MSEENKKSGGKVGIIIGVIVAILAMILVGVICYQMGAKGGSKDGADRIESSEGVKEVTSDKTSEESKEIVKESAESSEASSVVEESSEEASSESEEAQLPEKEEGEIAYPSNSGALAVKGTQLVDQNGEPVQLRGISTHGLAWFPSFVDQNTFRQFRNEWNVNVMRLAMYTAESGGFCTDGNQENLRNIIYRGVQYATDLDMYVIIDWHILQDQNPKKYMDEAEEFFDQMSAKYKDNNNVIYEICNEPNGGTTWKDIKEYAEKIIPVIRKNAPDAVILVGTPNWSQRVDQAAEDPIKGYDNIMYTLHFYAGTHKDDLRKTMKNALEDGLPIFVSEYGICDASGNGKLDYDSAEKWVELMDENNISYICWALANKNESAALIKSSCNKNSGFTDSDLSDHGKWLYKTLTGKTTGSGTSTGDQGGSKDQQPKQEEKETNEFTSGGFEIETECQSHWGADGKENYQYNFTITNNGDSKCKSWAIDIHFSEDIELESGWGANYTVNGKTLHCTNVDYNGTIKAGDTLKDLGFIIKTKSGCKVVK